MKSPQPRCDAMRIAGGNRKRSRGIHEPTRNLLPESRQAEGNARSPAEAPRIARGTIFAGRPRVDDGDRMSPLLQVACAGELDHARAVYRHVFSHVARGAVHELGSLRAAA